MKSWENYKPTEQGRKFHESNVRFRHLVWGIKSGKTYTGAMEFVKIAEEKSGSLCWVVAPTYNHLDVCEVYLEDIFNEEDESFIVGRNRTKRRWELYNGTVIRMRSAEWPMTLRGPNIDGVIWVDEAAYIKREAWSIIRQRVNVTQAPIFTTTTPNRLNWYKDEVDFAGILGDEYGEFQEGNRFVSHYPTDAFPWVSEEEIQDVKRSMTLDLFEQDYMAKFVSPHLGVFRRLDEAMSREPIVKRDDSQYVMGLDLAKQQDWTAVIIMDGRGQILHIDRWNKIDWIIQRERIKTLSEKWNCLVVLDSSNVGAMFEEDLRHSGVRVHPMAMNYQIKIDLINALQLAFERAHIHIPHPETAWAPACTRILIDELRCFESKLTPGGRITYAAPKSKNDDMVVALALANWGRVHGFAGGGLRPVDMMLARKDWDKNAEAKMRPDAFRKIFGGGRTSVGFQRMRKPFWR